MEDTLGLDSSAFKRASSSLARGTIFFISGLESARLSVNIFQQIERNVDLILCYLIVWL